jgi:hypothetical protein
VAFPGGIHPRYIVGAQPLVNGSPAGAYVHNPAFAPTAVTDSTAGEPAPDPVLRESASSSVPVGHSAVRSPAVSVSAGPEEVQREVREISEVIAGEFGIRLDSGAAVAAVEQSNPHVGEATLAKVREHRWNPNELRGLRAALEHFAPILGERRSRSGRAGVEQEVTHVGAVSFGVTNRKIDFGMAGEYIGSHKMLNFYAPVLIGKDFGGGRREIEGTATHELAHGLLKYALPEFTDAFGSWGPDGRPRLREGAEPPYGNATSAMADLEASIKASFLVPDKFAAESPKHAEAITALKGRHPGVFERKPGELSGKAAARIARELKSELPEFNKMVGSWTEDGWPAFEGELPITLYAATNANEDLSETAKYYFLEPETLRAKAPKRAAFFDRLVAEWNTSASETEPGVQPVSSSPDGGGNDLSAGKPPLVGEVHETGPAHPVAEEPTVSPATTAALPRLVDGGLPDAHSEPRQVEGLSQAQAVRLSRLTLRAVDMPTDGNCFFHALIRLAPAEVAASSGSTGVPPTPAQVRAHLADALAQDLGCPEGDRRLWPTVDGQALAALIDDGEVPQEGLTDRLRRDIIEALRTPGSYDNAAGDIAPVVAGQVFGLTIEVVLPDGSLYEVGDPDGHRIVVARVPREARGYDHWIAGVPIGAVSSRTGVRAGGGDVATGGVRAGLTASAPGHPARPGRASSRERAAAPPAFFDAPRPVATEDDRPAQDMGAVVRRRQHGTGDGAIGSRPQLDRMPPALRDSGRESGFWSRVGGRFRGGPDAGLVSRAVRTADGSPVGRSFHSRADWEARRPNWERFDAAREREYGQLPVPGARDISIKVQAAPWAGGVHYFWTSHGRPGHLEVEGASGPRKLTGVQAAAVLRRRPSFQRLLAAYPQAGVVLVACSTGATDGGVAQEFSDALGVRVFAPTGTVAMMRSAVLDGRTLPMVAHNDGRPGEFRTFRPGASRPAAEMAGGPVTSRRVDTGALSQEVRLAPWDGHPQPSAGPRRDEGVPPVRWVNRHVLRCRAGAHCHRCRPRPSSPRTPRHGCWPRSATSRRRPGSKNAWPATCPNTRAPTSSSAGWHGPSGDARPSTCGWSSVPTRRRWPVPSAAPGSASERWPTRATCVSG